MHFTLLVSGALLPGELAVALTASLDTPNLKARLARAALIEQPVSSQGASAHLDWLANKLFGQPPPVPTAPYAYAQLAGAAPPACVWHADPVHIEVARDQLLVQSLGAEAPTADESVSLLAVANEVVSESNCRLVDVGKHWFLLAEHEWQIDARPLAAAMEAAVEMPGGLDAQIWNRLHNEIQMAWHVHAVNAEREANGVRTVNAIWLHGGGRWKPLPPIEFAQVHSDAPEWRGAAQAAGARCVPASTLVADTALLIIDDAWGSRQRQDWGAWLQAITAVDRALGEHPADSIDLILCGNTLRTFELRPFDRYKPWRRRTLVQARTE